MAINRLRSAKKKEPVLFFLCAVEHYSIIKLVFLHKIKSLNRMIGKPDESLGRKATGPVKWQPVVWNEVHCLWDSVFYVNRKLLHNVPIYIKTLCENATRCMMNMSAEADCIRRTKRNKPLKDWGIQGVWSGLVRFVMMLFHRRNYNDFIAGDQIWKKRKG